MTTKFWKPIGSSNLIRNPRWEFFAPVNSTGRGAPPPPSTGRLQLLCQCFIQAMKGSTHQLSNWLVRPAHADTLAPRPPGWMVWRWPWQQRNDGGGCATMRERSGRMESTGTYLTEWVLHSNLCLALCTFGLPSCALVVVTWRGVGCRNMMRLIWTVKRALLMKIKESMSSIWANESLFIIVCECYLTWHDYPILVEGESHGILYYNIRLRNFNMLNFNLCVNDHCVRNDSNSQFFSASGALLRS